MCNAAHWQSVPQQSCLVKNESQRIILSNVRCSWDTGAYSKRHGWWDIK